MQHINKKMKQCVIFTNDISMQLMQHSNKKMKQRVYIFAYDTLPLFTFTFRRTSRMSTFSRSRREPGTSSSTVWWSTSSTPMESARATANGPSDPA